MNRIRLSPGERAEIVVRVKPGENTMLRGYPTEDQLDVSDWETAGGKKPFDVLQLRAANHLAKSPELPGTLAKLDLPTGEHPAKTRTFQMSDTSINGKDMDMNRIDHTVVRGTEEVWKVSNEDDQPHNFHIHDVQFAVLSYNGRAPSPALRGPKDTVLLPAGSEVRLAMRFDGPSDPNIPFMFHCHLLTHEDQGMMGQFVVVEPGQKKGRVPQRPSGGHSGHQHG